MNSRDSLTISQVSARSGFAASALRYYEQLGLITASRSAGGRRMFQRVELRRLAFIRAASNVGLSLDEINAELALLPEDRAPTRTDWKRISRHWRKRLDEQMAALRVLRDGLDDCIGCGCLSLRRCALHNPADVAATSDDAPGATRLPPVLRR